jgi:hypothetical protein
MNRHKTFAALLCAAALSACDMFEKSQVQIIAGPVPAGAKIRFFNFGVNAPGVNFYANERKVTAILSATGVESTTGVVYGNVGSGGFYTTVDAGQYTLSGKIAAATDKDLAISNIPATLEDGKFYSFFQSGFYNTTAKTVDGFVVEDDFAAAIDFSVAYVRFVHGISNGNPMTLYVRNTTTTTETAVGGEVAYKAAGAFTAVPGGVYDLNTRYAGQSTNAVSRTGVSFLAGRVYTVGARGDITVTSTTAVNRPFLDNTANR